MEKIILTNYLLYFNGFLWKLYFYLCHFGISCIFKKYHKEPETCGKWLEDISVCVDKLCDEAKRNAKGKEEYKVKFVHDYCNWASLKKQ